MCKVKLYPTAIHMIIDCNSSKVRKTKRQIDETSGNDASNLSRNNEVAGEIMPSPNAMGSLLVSAIPNNFDVDDTQNMLMESRVIMGGSD